MLSLYLRLRLGSTRGKQKKGTQHDALACVFLSLCKSLLRCDGYCRSYLCHRCRNCSRSRMCCVCVGSGNLYNEKGRRMTALWANFICGVFTGFTLAVVIGVVMQYVAMRKGR